jgi:hypothetical protein
MASLVSGRLAQAATSPSDTQLACTISQVTHTTTPAGGGITDVDEAGTRIATLSTADFTGGNADGNAEVFLIDTDAGTVIQLTHATGANSFSLSPSIDGSGNRIAVSSNFDVTGDNPERNYEVFLIDATSGRAVQLTRSQRPDSTSRSPVINAAGTRVAFLSNADFTGSNADGNFEIFVGDTTTASLTQLTESRGDNTLSFISIDAAGTRIPFHSNADFTGDNADGNTEIFLVDATTGTITQLTHTIGNRSRFPSIDGSGTRIVFVSDADLTGGNPGEYEQFFLLDIVTGALSQLTTGPGFENENLFGPWMNSAGTRLVLVSSADLTGDNPNHFPEHFLFDLMTRHFTQLTRSFGQAFGPGWGPAINATGARIGLTSAANLTGENPDRNMEVFLASCGLVNEWVSVTALPSTFKTTVDASLCPTGFSGTFSFVARIAAYPSSPALIDLRVQVLTLTNGNLLQNADNGPGRVAAILTVPRTHGYTDGILGPDEAVDVPFVICLQDLRPFRFMVDVLGQGVSEEGATP